MQKYDKSDYPYTPLFCEENIWHLAKSMIDNHHSASDLEILLFSNPDRRFVMFNQANHSNLEYTIWDYHVALKACIDNEFYVFDFDTKLDFPVSLIEYLSRSFADQTSIPEELRACVRIIPADDYLRHFYSDRHHMRGLIDDDLFPVNPIIDPQDKSQRIALVDYWQMNKQLNDSSRVVTMIRYFDSFNIN